MKKSVYIPGIASTTLMLFGCMFKIMHWPGASIMLILSVFLFCFYFLPVALIANYKTQETPKHKALHIITFVVFFICVMGVLFKVMHWPGAGIFLMVGLPLPFVLFLPAYLYSTRNEKKENNINFLGLMFGLTFLAVFSVLLALSISKQVLRNGITRSYCIERSTAFVQSAIGEAKPENEVRKYADELCAYIQNIKLELLKFSKNEEFTNRQDKLWQMNNADSKLPAGYALFANEGKTKFAELRQRVGDFKKTIVAGEATSQQLKDLASSLFNVDVIQEMLPNGNVVETDWEQREFSNKQLVFVLGALSQIQNNVRIVELEYLTSVK
jgi:hypothetical protein